MRLSEGAAVAELQLRCSSCGRLASVWACRLRKGAELGVCTALRQESRWRSGKLEGHVVVFSVASE